MCISKIKYSTRLVLFLIISALMSCEKIIDITIPDRDRKIVVNGLISPDKPVSVNLSRSLSVLETDTLDFISGAEVTLFHGNDQVGKLKEGYSGNYYLTDFLPQVGESYRLTASAGDLTPIEATALVPAVVPFMEVDTTTLTGEWGQKELRLRIKFHDPAGIKNIYAFGVDMTFKEYDYNTMTWTGKKNTQPVYLFGNNDQFLQDESHEFQGKLFFDDKLFDGMEKSVEFGLSDYTYFNSDTIWLTVRMEQIDPSYFLYIVSSEAYQQANGNPFSEPVQVFTNVNHGYGIFGGSSASLFQMILKGMGKY